MLPAGREVRRLEERVVVEELHEVRMVPTEQKVMRTGESDIRFHAVERDRETLRTRTGDGALDCVRLFRAGGIVEDVEAPIAERLLPERVEEVLEVAAAVVAAQLQCERGERK